MQNKRQIVLLSSIFGIILVYIVVTELEFSEKHHGVPSRMMSAITDKTITTRDSRESSTFKRRFSDVRKITSYKERLNFVRFPDAEKVASYKEPLSFKRFSDVRKITRYIKPIDFKRFTDAEKTDVPKTDVEKNLEVIPDWLVDYINWHTEQRKNNLNRRSTKYLTVACLDIGFCGGVSDRLKNIPYFLWMAYKTSRVLFIKWEKYDLEDFLLPTQGGLDWRLPEGVDIGDKYDIINEKCLDFFDNPSDMLHQKKNLVVRVKQLTYHLYKKELFTTAKRPFGTYSEIMNILFQPTPPLFDQIKSTMNKLGLIPKQYIAAHYRGKDITYRPEYLDAKKALDEGNKITITNAINCVVHKYRNLSVPVYFTSSTSEYVKYALRESPFSKKNSTVKVVGIDDIVRLHTDSPILGYDFKKSDPKDLYPAFVDLWIMGYSNCVSYGRLGFGEFGARLANEKCQINHDEEKCPLVATS